MIRDDQTLAGSSAVGIEASPDQGKSQINDCFRLALEGPLRVR